MAFNTDKFMDLILIGGVGYGIYFFGKKFGLFPSETKTNVFNAETFEEAQAVKGAVTLGSPEQDVIYENVDIRNAVVKQGLLSALFGSITGTQSWANFLGTGALAVNNKNNTTTQQQEKINYYSQFQSMATEKELNNAIKQSSSSKNRTVTTKTGTTNYTYNPSKSGSNKITARVIRS